MTDQQTNDLAAWTSIVISLIAFIVLFLKGRWTVIIVAIAATVLSRLAIFGTYWHHIITEPLRWWPLVAIFRLAKPSSRWADWFYNEPKMQLARERYPTANPVPRSLRKQAIRNLRAIGRGDYSALGGEAQKAPGENEWKTIADRLSEAGWTWGCTERVDSQGKTIFVADAHHGGKSFAVRADNKLTAFSELERQVRAEFASILPSIPSAIPPPPVDISVSRPKAPTKRPLYATVFAVIIIVMLGVAARSFVDRRKSETNLGQSSQKQKESEAAKFATYARNLREQVVQEVEPQAFVPTSRPVTQRFPWKSNIVTTVFWIGEKEHQRSAWDGNWLQNYGGLDNPDASARRDYIPVGFTPRQNPFYCALPYNDVSHGQFKPEAPLVIPWFKQAYAGPGQSVCQHHWIAIRKGNRTCFAQWEDCGPFRTDHYQYVFQNERPKPNLNRGAGLDVSPAVRDYLGLQPTDVTDWRFVDTADVPPGPWRSYGDNNHFVIARRQAERQLAQKTSASATKK